jgi:hypothetical protein
MRRGPGRQHPLWHVALIVGLGVLVLAPTARGCSASSTSSRVAVEQARTPLQRRTGPPAQPPQDPAPGAIKISGTERLQWEQRGKSLDEVKQWRYLAIVGVARTEMKDVTCAAANGPKGSFVCSGILPALDRGNHQLRLVTVDGNGGRELSSPWSRPLLVFKE